MKANEEVFLNFLEGHDKHFVIPVYQRNYDWRIEHCKQLFEDITDVCKNNSMSHFFGSIVFIYDEEAIGQTFLIVDGQQRITTVSLLLLALYNLIDKDMVTCNFDKGKIRDTYLVNKYDKKSNKIKLKSVEQDNKAFTKLFYNNEEDYIKDSNITKNYNFFIDRIKNLNVKIDDFYEGIKKLMIVQIKLTKEDAPQLIFESLNSTGLDLTQADQVRNYILMNKSADEQERLYYNYWNKIELNTSFKSDGFIRDYLTLKQGKIPRKDRIYVSFKKYVASNNYEDTIEELLKDLLRFSTFYKNITSSSGYIAEINKGLKYINKLDITVSFPFLLEVFKYYDNKILTDENVIEVLEIVKSFVFRRLICDIPTNALNKIFMSLNGEIRKHEDFKFQYVGILKYILINKKGSQRFPTDSEFAEKIISKDVYNLNSKNRIHLLESLETYNNKERVDVEELLKAKELNVEHIMPQTLTPRWKENLGDDKWENVYSKYLNTLGNITLTGYNTKMSNKSFLEKRDMKNGFKDSTLHLNKFLKDLDCWNEKAINARAEILEKNALKIWIYPGTEYLPKIDLSNRYSLADDYNFTGAKIISYEFMGGKYEVNSWRDLYRSISMILYDLEPAIFKSFLFDDDFKGKKRDLISKDENKLRSPLKITEDIFLETNLSAESILEMIRLVLKKYDLEGEEVDIYLKD